MVLVKMKEIAEAYLGEEVIDAVVQKESKPLELRNTDWQYGG